jgi:predicted dehydrogenase
VTKPLRLGLVGTGRIAQAYLAALRDVSDATLVAVADVNTDVARATAEAESVASYPDHREMLRAESLDAAIVCTPPVTHRDIVRDLLDTGIHVLCEKPIATCVDDVVAMMADADAAERQLMMASKFRYVDDIAHARALIRAGILGKPVQIENAFASWLDVRDRWNSNPAISGGGVLIDNGTHSADIVRFLVGPICEVMAYKGRQVQNVPVEDTCHVSLRTESGACGTIDLSWSVTKERAWFVEVFGTEGMLRIGWKGSCYRQNHASAWVEFGKGYDKHLAFRNKVQDFLSSCRGSSEPRITREDAIASVAVIEAAYASAKSGCWVSVPDVSALRVPQTTGGAMTQTRTR